MGCSVRRNRHGYLAFRLYFDGLESHEGTKLRDTPENRRRVEARAKAIDQEIRDGAFDYLRWFPSGNLSSRFEPERSSRPGKSITLRRFFGSWTASEVSRGTVSLKWQRNRESYLRSHVLPLLGNLRLDELCARDLVSLQTRLRRQGLAPSTVDRVVHSALRGLVRDADLAGYVIPAMADLFDRRFVRRLAQTPSTADIDPYTDEERDRILDWFRASRPAYHPFVHFRFWTGTRPSEAIALRWKDVDLRNQVVKIRRSRVLGVEGPPKTGRSKRNVLLPAEVVRMLSVVGREAGPSDYVFVTPRRSPIDEVNFQRREWAPALRALSIRSRPFYNTRHTYISLLLAAGAAPLFVCRQTGTSLEMIERHYGDARTAVAQLDSLLRQFDGCRRTDRSQ